MMSMPAGRDRCSNLVKRSRWSNVYLQVRIAANLPHDWGCANEVLVKKHPDPVSHVSPGGLCYSTSGLRCQPELDDEESLFRCVFSPLCTGIFNVEIRDENGVAQEEAGVGNRSTLRVSWRRARPGNAQLDDGVVWQSRLRETIGAKRE
jgi:hypothetical protein